MHLIRAGTRDDVHNAASRVSVLRGEIRGLQIEFLHGVRVWEWNIHIQIGVIVASSIELVIDLSHSGAVYTSGLLTRIDAAVSADTASITTQIDSARREKNKRLRKASVQRKFDNLPFIDELTHRSGSCCHKLGISFYCHSFRYLTDLHGD